MRPIQLSPQNQTTPAHCVGHPSRNEGTPQTGSAPFPKHFSTAQLLSCVTYIWIVEVRMSHKFRFRLLAVAVCLLMLPPAFAQQRPLPNAETFLQETKKHLQTDSALQSSYSYVETRRELKIDSRGQSTGESVKVFESYPGLPGEGRWERLISEDGKPVPADQLAKVDRERKKKAEDYAQRLASAPAKTTADQRRDWEKDQRETARIVDDIYRVYDIRMVGRETIDGHDTIAFSLTARANAQPQTREGGMMRHFAVRAWVSETDYELARLEAEATDTVPIALGLLARVSKGSRLTFERRKVNDEVWLPARATYMGSARIALVKTIRRGGSSEYSNYKKFTVGTTTTFDSPSTSGRQN